MVCGSVDGREVYAVTHDIVPDRGWVMQFKVTLHPNAKHNPREHGSPETKVFE